VASIRRQAGRSFASALFSPSSDRRLRVVPDPGIAYAWSGDLNIAY
jgi:hypothetical protein